LCWRDAVSPDKRPALLALGLFLVFQVIHFVQPIGLYFGIITKPEGVYLDIVGLVVVWFVLMQATWRLRLFERMLGLST
jgi:hypothetical protein